MKQYYLQIYNGGLWLIFLVWILVYLKRLHYSKGKKGKGTHMLKAQMAGAYPGFLGMKHA